MKNAYKAKVGDVIASASGNMLTWGKVIAVRESKQGNVSFDIVGPDGGKVTLVPQRVWSWGVIVSG